MLLTSSNKDMMEFALSVDPKVQGLTVSFYCTVITHLVMQAFETDSIPSLFIHCIPSHHYQVREQDKSKKPSNSWILTAFNPRCPSQRGSLFEGAVQCLSLSGG